MSSQPTPDQLRAKHAWEVVQRIKPTDGAKPFGGAARKLPVRIMASGLGQALAFLRAKDKTPELLTALSDWVIHRPKDGSPRFAVNQDRTPATTPEERADAGRVWAGVQGKLLDAVIAGDADALRMYTAEALVYLQWLIRFCEAEKLTADEEGDG